MIEIAKDEDCCGCSACVQACPVQCIGMVENAEGFLYPIVDVNLCIHCGKCEKVCPVVHVNDHREPLKVYAAKSHDESVRLSSSSGGVFALLASAIIDKGGVVFGARFDEYYNVIHAGVENRELLIGLCGSKYVQSHINGAYSQAEILLKQGRWVLFSGTPCQVAGLKQYLGADYPNLLTVDVICHGVPSPMVWRNYVAAQVQKLEADKIQGIFFRDKTIGWKQFCLTIKYEKEGKSYVWSEIFNKNSFMRGFLANLYLRPICYECRHKDFKSGADITLGDFWGISNVLPELDDNRGISCVFVNSQRGNVFWQEMNCVQQECSVDIVSRYNPSLLRSVDLPIARQKFYRSYGSTPFERLVASLSKKTLKVYMISYVMRILRQCKFSRATRFRSLL